MGQANGIGQSFAAGTRAIGPAIAGLIWSLSSHASYPLHSSTIFILLALFSLLIYYLTRFFFSFIFSNNP